MLWQLLLDRPPNWQRCLNGSDHPYIRQLERPVMELQGAATAWHHEALALAAGRQPRFWMTGDVQDLVTRRRP